MSHNTLAAIIAALTCIAVPALMYLIINLVKLIDLTT